MKKIVIITLFAILIICLIIGMFFKSYNNNRILDEQVVLEISDLIIEQCNDEHIKNANACGYELSDDIRYNMDKYKVISMLYHIRNDSNTITMEDVRCRPKFQHELKSRLVTYNSGNGIYYVFIQPNSVSGFRQYIFINADNISDTEIYNSIWNEHIEVTCFTDSILRIFQSNTGRGWIGLGKYSYEFTIKNCLK